MNPEDIQSPLPSRNIELPPEGQEVLKKESQETVAVNELPEERVNLSDTADTSLTSNSIPPKKKNFAIYFAIGALVLAVGVIIFGVLIPKLTGKTKVVTLDYWGLWEDNETIAGVIADFESKNPGIKINYKKSQKIDYRTRLKGRLAKSNTAESDVPDIFRIHNTWIPMFKDDLAPVPNTTSQNLQLDQDFYDIYRENLKDGGNFLAIPLMYDGLGLFYNKDLIDSAQVVLPKSWWDLETAAGKMTVVDENGKIKIAGVSLGLVDNVDHWSDVVGLMLQQNNVNIVANDENNEKKLKDVLSFYTLFRTKKKVWDESLPASTQFFANGKLAFYFAPSWRVFNIQEINPSLKFEITTVPQLPTLEGVPIDQTSSEANLTNIHWASYWVEGVNKQSKKQKEAWKFLEYLASKEGLEKMYTAQSQIRAFGEIYPRKSMADKLETNSKVKPFVSAAPNAVSWYLSSRTFDSGVNDDMSKYFGDAINSMVFNNLAADAVMPTLRNGINQVIQKYQIRK